MEPAFHPQTHSTTHQKDARRRRSAGGLLAGTLVFTAMAGRGPKRLCGLVGRRAGGAPLGGYGPARASLNGPCLFFGRVGLNNAKLEGRRTGLIGWELPRVIDARDDDSRPVTTRQSCWHLGILRSRRHRLESSENRADGFIFLFD